MKRFIGLAFVFGFALSGAAQAQSYREVGDAGQTVATAQSTGTSSAPLAMLFGSLGTATDADLYQIYISDPSVFSATTLNGGTSALLDTELFLLTANGTGIAANDDDQNGLSFNSTLPGGNAFYAGLSAGYYLLGISNSSNEPVNSENQLIFNMPTGGATTSVRGAAGGLNPITMANFNGNAADYNGAGEYQIDLTGVTAGPATISAAPEPGTWALMLGGVAALGLLLRRRRVGFALTA